LEKAPAHAGAFFVPWHRGWACDTPVVGCGVLVLSSPGPHHRASRGPLSFRSMVLRG
jgi:hypothetical protein